MTRTEAKKQVQKLIDEIDEKYDVQWWVSQLSDKGKMTHLAINERKGTPKNKTKTFKMLLAWAKKNRLPVIALKIHPSIGNQAFYKRYGFKKERPPGATRGHWWIKK